MNKQEILNKIKALDGLDNNEKAYLVNLVNTTKKYGLVWEDKPEDVEEELRTKLPILKEVKERAIINDNATENHPNHILIEGDNLHALTALTFTHEGKIDVIYIDPPYNTGNKDFKYNDSFVDKEDSYRHSKWLSFMDKRLRIAKRLLSEKGVIFISIDDNEQSQLKLLCDEVFGEINFISTSIRQAVKGGTRSKSMIAQNHDYLIVYCKNKAETELTGRKVEGYILDLVDEKSAYTKGRELNKWGAGSRREDSPTMWFPINSPEGFEVFPIRNDGSEGRWRWGKKKLLKAVEENDLIFEMRDNGTFIVYEKIRTSGDREIAQNSLLIDSHFSNAYGTEILKSIFGSNRDFSFPKPLGLIDYSLKLSTSDDSTILDFFAGSGTTLHATMALNAEDGGNRQCILVTNNENNICEEVTYERNKKVIKGYTNAKGAAVAGLKNNNLRYFKSEFISRNKTIKNKKELTKLATELLCIKEDCYNPVESKAKWYSAFADAKSQLIVIYDDAMLEESIAIIKKLNESKQNNNPIKVYVFSNGQYPYTEDFEEVLDFISLCALPDAIYKAYQNVLPKENKVFIPTLEDDINPEIAI